MIVAVLFALSMQRAVECRGCEDLSYLVGRRDIAAYTSVHADASIADVLRERFWFNFGMVDARVRRGSLARPDSGFRRCDPHVYMDDEAIWGRDLGEIRADDVGEARLYPTGSEWEGGKEDAVIQVRGCPVIQLIRIGQWYALRENRAAVIESLNNDQTPITYTAVRKVLLPFGIAWRPEGRTRFLFRHADAPACGSFDTPIRLTSDTLRAIQRQHFTSLLSCVLKADP